MKIQRPTNKNKKIIISVVILLTLLILLGVYLVGFKGSLLGWKPFESNPNYSGATKEQIDAGSATKVSSEKTSNSGESPNDVGADHPPKPTTQPGDTKTTATLTISAVNQNDGMLQIRTLIGILTSEGTCTLTLTQGSKTVTRTAGVQPTANSTTCKGFDIPVSELTTGKWQATVSFENTSVKASNSQVVNVL